MTFVSIAYALLLPLVFLVYWLALGRSVRAQNLWLLAAGYVFYGWWDWRFLGLLLLTTLTAWACALPRTHRRRWAALSVTVNLAVLGFFKYCGFFADNLRWLLANFGWEMDWFTVEVLLPVGISFYTLQAVGYSVDICRGDIAPERDPITFAAYISFFPQLVAGPIERAGRLLPQFRGPRRFDYAGAVEGMRRILWGLFKKVVVADGVALWVGKAFDDGYDPGLGGSVSLALGAWLFLIQIYADFSGYSDIARGSAQLLGFRLTDNFLFPLFSRNAREMWRRWHRSLMEWFREYVYIPLGGSRRGNRHVHVMAVFLLSGLWHGARWTFVLWGALCGLWLVLYGLIGRKAGSSSGLTDSHVATRADSFRMFAASATMAFNFIFFRADTAEAGFAFVRAALPGLLLTFAAGAACCLVWRRWRHGAAAMGAVAGAAVVAALALRPAAAVAGLLFHLPWAAAAFMLWCEWRSRRGDFGLSRVPRHAASRAALYLVLAFFILTGATQAEASFIYFRF